jgi:hypothetical protein
MAKGAQFLQLYTDLRAELRRSTSVAVGSDDLDVLKRTINHVYRTLYIDFEWPHMRKVFPKITLNAGQRYYDFPADLDNDLLEKAVVWNGNVKTDLQVGIGFDEYGYLDSDEDERQDPIQAIDFRFTGTSIQLEVWPIPASSDNKLQLKGYLLLDRLVNDIDKCWLDDELVVLFAAAELLKGTKAEDADSKLLIAQGYLQRLKARSKGPAKHFSMGLGSQSNSGYQGVSINIKPRA